MRPAASIRARAQQHQEAFAMSTVFERRRKAAPATDALCTRLAQAWAITERQAFCDQMLRLEEWLQAGREAPDEMQDEARALLRSAGGW